MLRFWSSKLHFWRKSRTKASFFSLKACFLKEVSQKCVVFELQSFNFEGSLAEKLRFPASQLQFWRKSRRNASFLSFKASFLKEVSQKSFVFELKSFNFEGSLAEKLRVTKSFESHISWQPNHLNLKPFDIQITWISNQLTTTSLEVQINRQPKSFEAHIDWRPNQLNLKSIDSQINWISNQLTTKIIWISNQMTTKSFEAHIDWQPNHLNLKSIDNQNHLNLKSDDNQIIWLSTRLNLTSIDFRTNWTPHTPFL